METKTETGTKAGLGGSSFWLIALLFVAAASIVVWALLVWLLGERNARILCITVAVLIFGSVVFFPEETLFNGILMEVVAIFLACFACVMFCLWVERIALPFCASLMQSYWRVVLRFDSRASHPWWIEKEISKRTFDADVTRYVEESKRERQMLEKGKWIRDMLKRCEKEIADREMDFCVYRSGLYIAEKEAALAEGRPMRESNHNVSAEMNAIRAYRRELYRELLEREGYPGLKDPECAGTIKEEERRFVCERDGL